MDFLYAVVVGTAVPRIDRVELSFLSLGTAFLLLVILEDFFLYQTQVGPLTRSRQRHPLAALPFEVAVLAVWYLLFVAFPAQPRLAIFGHKAGDDGMKGPLVRGVDVGMPIFQREQLPAILKHKPKPIGHQS